MSGQRYISTKFSLLTNFLTSTSKTLFVNIKSYEVEFSKPHSLKPIPEGTVKVFFSIIEKANGEHIIEFNFENESLKHKLDNTMRTNMFEVYLLITFLSLGSTECWKTSSK